MQIFQLNIAIKDHFFSLAGSIRCDSYANHVAGNLDSTTEIKGEIN